MSRHLDVLPSEEAGVYRPYAGSNHCQCSAESCHYMRLTRQVEPDHPAQSTFQMGTRRK